MSVKSEKTQKRKQKGTLRRRKERRITNMNIRSLTSNIEIIEQTLEQFEKGELTYKKAHVSLMLLGYSEKEAKNILANKREKKSGTDTGHRD